MSIRGIQVRRRVGRRSILRTLLIVGGALPLAACASGAPPAPAPTQPAAPQPTAATKASAPPQAAVPTQAPAVPQAPAPTQAPAKPKQLTKITMVQVIHGLPFSPVYVARSKGFFQDEGIDLDWQLVQGAGPAMAAISGGSAQLAAGSSVEMVTAAGKKLPYISVAGIVASLTFDTVVNKKSAQERNVHRSTPLNDRLKGLKGAKFGTVSLGGGPDRLARWLMVKAGYTLNDVEVLRIGGSAELLVALREGTIDAFMISPPLGPQAEKDGFGEIVLTFDDLPEFKDYAHEVLYTTKDYAEKNPQIVEGACRALARACNLILDQAQEADRVLVEAFKEFSPDVIVASVKMMRPAFPRDARMTEKQWANATAVLQQSGLSEGTVDPKEGDWWTNRFIKNIPSR